MAFYFNYIVTDFGIKVLGVPIKHTSLALTEHTPPHPPKIIVKLGLYGTNQVIAEDDFQPNPNIKLSHKTYPITAHELDLFMKKLNTDREMGVLHLESRDHLMAESIRHGRESKPGGPAYSFFCFNCKSYALSMMRAIGIQDKSLNNWLIDNPAWSGQLSPLDLELVDKHNFILEWKSPLVVSERFDPRKLKDISKKELDNICTSIQYNEYHSFIQEMNKTLQDPKIQGIKGIETLLLDIEGINRILENTNNVCKELEGRINGLLNTSSQKLDFEKIQKELGLEYGPKFEEFRKNPQEKDKTIKQLLGDFLEHLNQELLKKSFGLMMTKTSNSIQKFESEIDPKNKSLKKYIVDTFKQILNHLGAKFELSHHYRAKPILHKYKKLHMKMNKHASNLQPKSGNTPKV